MGESRLQHLNNEVNALEKDISDNNKEIRLLNNKITKSDL
jgi:peptidoglycan hydrolase CwlO-like protein